MVGKHKRVRQTQTGQGSSNRPAIGFSPLRPGRQPRLTAPNPRTFPRIPNSLSFHHFQHPLPGKSPYICRGASVLVPGVSTRACSLTSGYHPRRSPLAAPLSIGGIPRPRQPLWILPPPGAHTCPITAVYPWRAPSFGSPLASSGFLAVPPHLGRLATRQSATPLRPNATWMQHNATQCDTNATCVACPNSSVTPACSSTYDQCSTFECDISEHGNAANRALTPAPSRSNHGRRPLQNRATCRIALRPPRVIHNPEPLPCG
jgi:hypothetical protein